MLNEKQKVVRQQIIAFFIQTAQQENAKNGAKTQDFWSLLDKTTGRKRALYVIKESNGDCLFSTQLFESFHQEYPNHDLYVATQPKFFQVFEGNPHIFKLLPYMDIMEQEMIMGGAGQSDENTYFSVYFHPGILTQRQLGYLFSDTAAFKKHLDL